MKNWLISLFIKPHNASYQTIYFINRHLVLCLCLIIATIISYPLFEYSYTHWQIKKQEKAKTILNEKITQQKRLFFSLQQHIQENQKNNVQLTQINQQIKAILDKYQAKTEQWQWRLEQENKLYLSVNHHSRDLFNLLHELNQMANLYYQELNITKLHHNNLVQLSGLFVLSDKGK